MNDTAHGYLRQTVTALVALALVLSVLGPVGTVAADPSVSVEQTADSNTVAPGETVTLTTEFEVAELNAPQLSVTTPDGWEITDQTAEGPAAYNDDGTWQWLAGDEDGVNVSYTVEYTVSVPEDAEPGEYSIAADGSALAPSDSAPTSDSDSTTITVEEPDQNEGPSASFSASPSSPEAGETVSFDASGSTDADGSIESYEWEFGDGETASGEQVTHAFDDAGDYDVELTVTDDDGATDTDTQTISVSEAATPASFQLSDLTVESPVEQGDDATVTATVENVGDEEDAQTVTLDVDDGEVDSESVTLDGGASQQVSFDVDTADLSVGDHDVTLSTDDDSASATLSVTEQTPSNEDPTAAFDASLSDPETGETVTFDASGSTDADGSIESYEWEFGDGETATGESVTHAFDDAGEYDVELTVTDDDGATDTVTQTISVDEPAEPEPNQSTEVSLSPSEELVAVNGSTAYDVVVENVDGGVGTYTFTVSAADADVASVTDLELAESADGAITDVQYASDNSSVTVEAVLVDTEDTGDVTLGTVVAEGESEGETDVDLSVELLGDESGDAYEVTAENGATLTVSELVVGGSEQPAQDLDGDGVYEDVNGDGEVDELDVQLLFAERNSDVVQSSPETFDFNGDGEFNNLDVQKLYYEEVA
ncbi:PKD domain-containing protein [Halorubrum sp. AD140]|uniref:PKD domain-containing protein n=1 Tax=Halorubrum sp. AD140 TaxID=3050073 RepID=UPI002ACD0B85|nr:PKD domain-containing protein [Halorubrum sp. AD140]MDZ5812792.1 PKD domain-containing protein [Halorubrum sp. AD140]